MPESDVNTSAGRPGYDNAPSHYKGAGGIQNFDVWDVYDMDRYRASAWKYFTRFAKKGSAVNDLKKLVHYIDEAIIRQPEYTDAFLHQSSVALPPEVVIEAFGLDGQMADAAKDFLLSFMVMHPRVYLRSAKAHVEAYLASL